jgi:hypothetical protein
MSPEHFDAFDTIVESPSDRQELFNGVACARRISLILSTSARIAREVANSRARLELCA